MKIFRNNILIAGAAMAIFAAGAQAASVLDLGTSSSASGWVTAASGGQAYFENIDPEGAQGTGVLEPFLRIQGHGNEDGESPQPGAEWGYNTDTGQPGLETGVDTKTGVWTHSLTFGELGGFFSCSEFYSGDCTGNTDQYYRFVLDYNQTKHKPDLSLDDIEIWITADGTPEDYNGGDWTTKLFDLFDDDDFIELDYSVANKGSGQGDLYVYIPLTGFNLGDNFTMYSAFGAQTGYDWNDGFEEWAFVSGPCIPGQTDDEAGCGGGDTDVPEPSTMLLMGGSLLGLAWWRKRKNA